MPVRDVVPLALRRLVAGVVSATLLVGCGDGADPAATATSEEPSVDVFAVRVDALRRQFDEVVRAQQDALPMIKPALDALRGVDLLIPDLRDEETLDPALATRDAVRANLEALDLEPIRPALHELAFLVDEARLALDATLEVVTDPTDRAYLEAEDELLVALREHAKAADALAQVVALHLPSYMELLDLLDDFAERRGRFRSASEAADALEVEMDDLLTTIGIAQDDVALFLAERDEAGTAVNAAQDVASAAWDARPEATPTGPLPGEELPGEDLPGEEPPGEDPDA